MAKRSPRLKQIPTLPAAAPAPLRRAWMIAAALFLIVMAIYARTDAFPFIDFDDGLYIFQNEHVQSGLTLPGIVWAFTAWDYIYWQPLTWVSHMLDVQMFGLDAGWHHLTSAVLHGVNAILLFLVLLRLTGSLWRSAVVAALFAFHPLRVESVAWAAERKDVLSGFFALLTLWAYSLYCEQPKSLGRYAAVIGCYLLGLMSKPMLVTLPFLLLLLDEWPLRRLEPLSRRIVEKLPMFLLAGVVSVVTAMGQERYGATRAIEALSLSIRLANAITAYVHYLWKTVWPNPLAMFYPYRRNIPWVEVAICAAILTLISAAVTLFRRRYPYLFVGWFWFAGLLVPTIGVIQVGAQSMADRFSYLPSIGLWIALVWLAADQMMARHWRPQAVGVAVGLLLAGLSIGSWAQTAYWANGVTAFQHAVNVTSDNPLAQHNLGFALEQMGDNAGAVPHLKEALRLEPKYFQGHYNLGRALSALGRNEEALLSFSEAVRLKPDYAEAQYARALILQKLGQREPAEAAWRTAVQLPLQPPFAAQAHNSLGILLGEKRDLAGAIGEFREAIRIDPGLAPAQRNLAVTLAMENRLPEAIASLTTALSFSGDASLRELRDSLNARLQ